MGNKEGESYTGFGVYAGPAYIEAGKDGSVSFGVSAGASTPSAGPYCEGGAYMEYTIEKDGTHSSGHGTYVESGVDFGSAYTCQGKCWDSRNK